MEVLKFEDYNEYLNAVSFYGGQDKVQQAVGWTFEDDAWFYKLVLKSNETREVITLNFGDGYILEFVEVVNDNRIVGRGSHYLVHLDMRSVFGDMKPQERILQYPYTGQGRRDAKDKYIEIMTELQA